MKQPTKAQRLAIYKKALAKVRKNEDTFMCNEICFAYQKVMKIDVVGIGTNKITAMFPEFVAQKPKKLYYKGADGETDIWWNVRKIGRLPYHGLQIDVLSKCIKNLK